MIKHFLIKRDFCDVKWAVPWDTFSTFLLRTAAQFASPSLEKIQIDLFLLTARGDEVSPAVDEDGLVLEQPHDVLRHLLLYHAVRLAHHDQRRDLDGGRIKELVVAA